MAAATSTTTIANMQFTRPDGVSCPGYEAQPPALIVLQEWWGLNNQLKGVAEHLASAGFRVVVPDLYRGKAAKDREEAGHLYHDLDWAGAVADIKAAAAHLKATGSRRVGVTGFCMGGALALASAVLGADVDAVSVFYGIPPATLADSTKVRVPVQGHFGDLDPSKGFGDKESANQLEQQLITAGVELEFFRYPTAGHAFMNADAELRAAAAWKEGYQPEVAALAYERLIAFFRKHLQQKQ